MENVLARGDKKKLRDNDRICTCAGEPNRYRKTEAIRVCRLNYFWKVRIGREDARERKKITSATLSIFNNFGRKILFVLQNTSFCAKS
jgi:hypothetical protein